MPLQFIFETVFFLMIDLKSTDSCYSCVRSIRLFCGKNLSLRKIWAVGNFNNNPAAKCNEEDENEESECLAEPVSPISNG